jgi:hypothetical protein
MLALLAIRTREGNAAISAEGQAEDLSDPGGSPLAAVSVEAFQAVIDP